LILKDDWMKTQHKKKMCSVIESISIEPHINIQHVTMLSTFLLKALVERKREKNLLYLLHKRAERKGIK
jgi:hypothetical protein